MLPEVPHVTLRDADKKWTGCIEFSGIYTNQEDQAPTQNGNHGTGLTTQTTFPFGFWPESTADRGSGMRTKMNILIREEGTAGDSGTLAPGCEDHPVD